MILLYLILAVFALLIFILAVPIDIEFSYDNRALKKSRTRIVWLFGLIKFDIKAAKESSTRKKTRKAAQRKGKKRKKSAVNINAAFAVIQSKGFVKRVIRLIYEFVTAAELRRLHWRMGFGLDDPADTGRVYGLMSTAFTFSRVCPQVDFAFIPLFDRAAIETEINAALRLRPIKFVWVVLSFIFSVESFRAISAVRKTGKV